MINNDICHYFLIYVNNLTIFIFIKLYMCYTNIGDTMNYNVRERLNRHFLLEILLIIIFWILGLNKLFNFNQLIYNIIDMFNIKFSMIIKSIIEFLPLINCSLIIYIIAIEINFSNVNYLTKEYINDYIKKTKIIYTILTALIVLYSCFFTNIYGIIIMIFYTLFVFYFLKIWYTKFYFRRVARNFITKEEYEIECAKIENKLEENVEDEKINKRIDKSKIIKIIAVIYLILWIVNFLILFIVPSCGLFSTCNPDGLRIFLINAIILFWIGVISAIIIIALSIIFIRNK